MYFQKNKLFPSEKKVTYRMENNELYVTVYEKNTIPYIN